jgi:hypothetical protein
MSEVIIVDWDSKESFKVGSYYGFANNDYFYLFKWAFKVYFRNIFGQIAKIRSDAIRTIGSIPILSPRSTINGPHIAPNNPKAYVMPTAVDWIWFVNAYVCTEAIKVYEIAKYI